MLALLSCASPPGELPSVGQARAVLHRAQGSGAADRTGQLWLRCSPEDAGVWVDGIARGNCQQLAGRGLTLEAVGGGMHRVDVKKDGFWPYVTYYDPDGVKAALTIRLRPLGQSEGEAR